MRALAEVYRTGAGVKADPAQAAKWDEKAKAAAKGEPRG